MNVLYQDRADAGATLAGLLGQYAGRDDLLVLGDAEPPVADAETQPHVASSRGRRTNGSLPAGGLARKRPGQIGGFQVASSRVHYVDPRRSPSGGPSRPKGDGGMETPPDSLAGPL